MRAAREQVEEINRMRMAVEKTNSVYLKNDYAKSIRRLQSELKEYCYYRGFDFKEIMRGQ